jgi:hypothetical protein
MLQRYQEFVEANGRGADAGRTAAAYAVYIDAKAQYDQLWRLSIPGP